MPFESKTNGARIAVKTRYSFEQRAARDLGPKGFECLLPESRDMYEWKDRSRCTTPAAVSGYLSLLAWDWAREWVHSPTIVRAIADDVHCDDQDTKGTQTLHRADATARVESNTEVLM